MNAIAMKMASYNEDMAASEYDSSVRVPRSKRKYFDPDVTEITVNIDHLSDIRDLSGRFDLERLRAENFEPVNIASLVKGYRDPAGRRLAPRHEIKITVVLYTNHRSFRTSTMNVSAGGAMLQDQLPSSFASEPFDILFIYEDSSLSKKRYFMMKGQAVGTQLQTNRVQFKGASPSTKESFHKFVEELAV